MQILSEWWFVSESCILGNLSMFRVITDQELSYGLLLTHGPHVRWYNFEECLRIVQPCASVGEFEFIEYQNLISHVQVHVQGRSHSSSHTGQTQVVWNKFYLSLTKNEWEKRMKTLVKKCFRVRFEMNVHTATHMLNVLKLLTIIIYFEPKLNSIVSQSFFRKSSRKNFGRKLLMSLFSSLYFYLGKYTPNVLNISKVMWKALWNKKYGTLFGTLQETTEIS